MSEALVKRGSLSERARFAARELLAGQRGGLRAYLAFVGPAVIASIAYMDPGNFATNIQAGAKYGYGLLWVVLLANVIAMLFQGLSAKLGIVTGRNLAEMCREQFPGPIVWAMWVISEIAAMATDLAEFLGGAIGLSLLFQMPLLVGMTLTALVTYGILMVESSGFRPVELIIGSLVGIIGLCYLIEVFIAPVDWSSAALHSIVPQIADAQALVLAVGILGATVMPHAVYLHSGLTQSRMPVRNDNERRKVLKFSNQEVIIALAIAGVINMAMVMMASAAFHAGHDDVAEIETAYHTLTPLLGIGAAGIFLLSLIASGVSSSAVGTMAGQMIMQGFVRFQIPIWLRRLVTMIPALIVVALGVNATQALVISQVVLSITLPLPMIALLIFTRRADIMGQFANSRLTNIAALLGTTVVLLLNIFLVLQTCGIPLPGLSYAR
jgi:manganese transport protein